MPKPRNAKLSVSDKVAAIKRDNILDAARTVFAKRGYHRTTIKNIAAQAGVADGTVYNYFDSKDDLLSALFDKLQDGMRQSDVASDQPSLMRLQQSLEPQMLELVRVMLSELLVDVSLRKRYIDRLLAPLFQFGTMTAPDSQPDSLNERVAAATALGLIMMQLLDDPVVNKHWERVPELLLRLAQPR